MTTRRKTLLSPLLVAIALAACSDPGAPPKADDDAAQITILEDSRNIMDAVAADNAAGLTTIDPTVITSDEAATVRELEWKDLIPADYQPEKVYMRLMEEAMALDDSDPAAADLMDQLKATWSNAPVRKDLNGQTVKLPGFVVPLQDDGKTVTEFLLVPYFGACIHTPPPPSNQIVFVRSDEGYPSEDLFDPVWVTGKLSVERFDSDIGDAGYALASAAIAPYADN